MSRSIPSVSAMIALVTALTGCVVASPAPRAAAEADPALGDPTPGHEGDDPTVALPITAGAAAPSVVAEAARIVNETRATAYAHHTHIDESTGTFDVDCSAFAGYVLLRAAEAAHAELIAATVKRPLARHFVEVIAHVSAEHAPHWRRLARASDLQPGDLIAWLRPADSKSRDTGHVMIVADPARVHDGMAEVPIFDASALPHGRTDQRAAGAHTGVGRGTIVLELDLDGAPIAFRWAPGAHFHRHATMIVLGRVR